MKKALVLAAGLGTRLKPWTLEHPKALVPVDGVPMLERVLRRLEDNNFDHIAVNVHHFADQIISYLSKRRNRAHIIISDETNLLLDTGGGILQADLLLGGDGPLLIHNTDILSNAPLEVLMDAQTSAVADAILLTSNRHSSRKLVFSADGNLIGWKNETTGEVRPEGSYEEVDCGVAAAFSGIYVMGHRAVEDMRRWADRKSFPIMDYLLANCRRMNFRQYHYPALRLLDIGKPDALARASDFIRTL